jgi:hypothetical protein
MNDSIVCTIEPEEKENTEKSEKEHSGDIPSQTIGLQKGTCLYHSPIIFRFRILFFFS